ncbi:N-acetyl-D-glucosamine kinase isoform X2 [Octopus sinensis]|uniref:N-acetyl-D-glucosamine kinase n=1 Tax=Octopus sinensis TaxID=2607531 RepID=A0A7E6FBC9_9MOLL|nr:N-acetyl-D-glucosamine kinase isoform X2 [Octopus sinensis]
MSENVYFAGIEGGATQSKAILLDANGKILAEADGPGTNQYLIGLDECLKRVECMISELKEKAGLKPDLKLKSLGLSLSGGDELEIQQELKSRFTKNYSHLSEGLYCCSDTECAFYTVSDKGGVILIAGTGSNCQLINSDGSQHRCGGWGHLIGDEGSAYWISLLAIKTIYDHEDNFVLCPYDISYTKEAIFRHFKISNKAQLLDYLYPKFEKANIARLCLEIVKGKYVLHRIHLKLLFLTSITSFFNVNDDDEFYVRTNLMVFEMTLRPQNFEEGVCLPQYLTGANFIDPIKMKGKVDLCGM